MYNNAEKKIRVIRKLDCHFELLAVSLHQATRNKENVALKGYSALNTE
jgi:hypothetical protein